LLWDTEISGFGFSQRWSNKRGMFLKRYVLQYRHGNKQRKITLDASKVSFGQAKEKAKEVFAQVELGIDPAALKEAARIEAARPSFEAAVAKYLDAQKSKLRARSLVEAERYLTRYFPNLNRLPLHTVTRDHIAPNLVRITEESGAPTASRARAILSSFFAWSMTQGLACDNPVLLTAKPEASASRERVLSGDEIRSIWTACADDDYSKIVKLLLLTGARRQEIGSLKWGEIHDNAIHLPAERCKNGRPHIIPLSDLALGVLASIPQRGEYVFGSSGFKIWAHSKSKLDAALGEMAEWRLHDARRTVATGLGELGVEPWIIESVLNHVSGHRAGVAGTYNRATHQRAMREALALWASHLEGIISGNQKVVPLRAA
jgi:integrase